MEQLSLFDFLTEEESKEKSTFTSEIQEELILVLSQAIMDVYRKESDQHERKENT